MIFHRMISAVFLAANLGLSQTEDIRGVVKDSLSLQPLGAVKVTWPKYSRTTLTRDDGAFALSSETPLRKRPEGGALPYAFRNGSLNLSLDRDQKVRIQVYSMRGKLVSDFGGAWTAGEYTVESLVHATGTYLFRLQIGRSRYAFRGVRMRDDAVTGGSRVPGESNAPILTRLASASRLSKAGADPAEADSLRFSKDGYHPKTVAVDSPEKMVVWLNPIVLRNGVRPGNWTGLTKQYTGFDIAVAQDGKTIDSLGFTLTLSHCATRDFSFSIKGPFDIPQDGFLALGDTVAIAFSDDGVSGFFFPKGRHALSASPPCMESQLILVDGAYIVQMVPNYNQVFVLHEAVPFDSRGMAMTTVAAHGTIKKDPDRPAYFPGDTVKVTAIPDPGYGFDSWSGITKAVSDSEATVIMNGPRTVVAEFSTGFHLTVRAPNASVRSVPAKKYYAPGEQVMLIGTPEKYYRTDSWTGAVSRQSGDTAWVVMDTSKTVGYNVVLKPRLIAGGENGQVRSLTPLPEMQYFEYGRTDTVTLVAIPDSGFRFLEWQGVDKASRDTAWVYMNGNRNVTAVFGPDAIRYRFPQRNINHAVAISPDGSLLALNGWDSISIWERSTGRFVRSMKAPGTSAESMQFSPDNSKLLVGFGYRQASALMDVGTGLKIRDYKSGACCGRSVAFSPTEPILATSGDSTAILWSTDSAAEIGRISTAKLIFNQLVFSPDGTKLAIGSLTDSVRIYDVRTQSRLYAASLGYGKEIHALAYTPDGLFLNALLSDGTLWQINASTGGALRNFTLGFTDARVAALSPDGKRLLVSRSGALLQLWNSETGKVHRQYRHPDFIFSMAFSPDNTQFLLGSYTSGNAELWDVR